VLGIDSRSLAGKAFNRIGYVSENQDMPEWMTVGALLDYYRAFYPTWTAPSSSSSSASSSPLQRKLKNLSAA